MHKTVFKYSDNKRGLISAVIRPEELKEFEKLGFVDNVEKMEKPDFEAEAKAAQELADKEAAEAKEAQELADKEAAEAKEAAEKAVEAAAKVPVVKNINPVTLKPATKAKKTAAKVPVIKKPMSKKV